MINQSIFMISWASLKRRKWQSLFVGLSIALSALLFSTTLGLLKGMEKPFDMMYDQLQASHLLLLYDQGVLQTSAIQTWFETQPEVHTVAAPLPYVALPSPAIFQEKEVDLDIQLTERNPNKNDQDQVIFSQGEVANFPAMGQIWIPQHLAESHHINLGDTIGIPTEDGLYPLEVSATLIDPQFASGLFNPTRAWVAPGSLSFLFPISSLNDFMLGIRFANPKDVNDVLGRFHSEMNFTGRSLDYALFKSVFLSFFQIISLILLIFSILSIILALFILKTTLSGSINKDLKLIGLYKGIGFTSFDILKMYLLQYLTLAFLSIPIGLIGSYFSTQMILGILFKTVGLANSGFIYVGAFILTLFLFLIFICLVVWKGSKNASKISPVEAMKTDISTGNHVIALPKILWNSKKLTVPFIWGMSMLLSNPKRSIYTGGSIVLAIFMILFSINVSHSFSNLKEEKAAWGFENSDLQLKRNEKIALPLDHSTMLSILKEEDLIQTILPYEYAHAILPKIDFQIPQSITGKVYIGNMDEIGLRNLEGAHPQHQEEISLCTLTAQELDKQVGDSISLFIEGSHIQFAITGIYQDVSNLGKGFRLPEPAMKKLNPLFEPSLYALKLKEKADIQDFQDHLQAAYGETMIIEQSVEERQGIRSTISGMQGGLGLISFFFLIILFPILFNDTLMNVRDYRRSLGILKAVGMTAHQLRSAQVYKFMILGIGCLLIGIPLGIGFSPTLISLLTQNLGLIEFPFQLHWLGSILVIPGILLFVSGSAWWASGNMAKTKAKQLIFNDE